ncbi:hypothetical protein QWZ08_13785 [Ferruginibacter paludis]|uniref:hypothetical protein n=1 Tax=Ferruginibacter paludis TaxID=1310417 RepID=UPI0025B46B02|nr:hypothetical protein [Ferruginibacter paludis]MDN3656711.1 hypothetical protein [Ferruginibacter paludis]
MSNKQPSVFISDINTHNRIREHFSNATDIISEEDIKNAVTNFNAVTSEAEKTDVQLQEA